MPVRPCSVSSSSPSAVAPTSSTRCRPSCRNARVKLEEYQDAIPKTATRNASLMSTSTKEYTCQVSDRAALHGEAAGS
jgi:hypothetical protein